MIRKIFLGCLALALCYVGYNVIDTFRAHNNLVDIEPRFIFGSEDADIAVVEFLDYSCIYCRQAHPIITQAVQRDAKIAYIPRPIAFENMGGDLAAKAVYAAAEQDQFLAMHNAVMENFESLTPQKAEELAALIGLDVAQFKVDLEAEKTQSYIDKNYEAFEWIGGISTPLFIIGQTLYYVPNKTMPSVPQMLTMFEEARELYSEDK